MNRDVFLSILAMDSYNRGYGQGINGLADMGSIGSATILRQSNILAGSTEVNVGFYASAYLWDGVQVISYRGTNFVPGSSISEFINSPAVKDIWNGWTVGAGFAGAGQAKLAKEFFTSVSGRSIYDPITPVGQPGTILTGHSLGGGLAGFAISNDNGDALKAAA
jgi:hypothetical protein